MGLASKNFILTSDHWDTREFDVPGWGSVRIRSLSGAERVALMTMAKAMDAGADDQSRGEQGILFTLTLVTMSLVDEHGKRLFTADDIDQLKACDFKKLERIAEEVLTFNGIGHKDGEDPEKN